MRNFTMGFAAVRQAAEASGLIGAGATDDQLCSKLVELLAADGVLDVLDDVEQNSEEDVEVETE